MNESFINKLLCNVHVINIQAMDHCKTNAIFNVVEIY